MSKFKRGDFVTRIGVANPLKYTVEHVAGSWMWVLSDEDCEGAIREVDAFELLAPFKVGHTYVSNHSSSRTFDCHFVGNIGAGRDNKKYAAGQLLDEGKPIGATAIPFRDSDSWTEI